VKAGNELFMIEKNKQEKKALRSLENIMMEIKASRKSNPRMAFVWRLRFAASS
jgi:hypothetical protein